MSLVRELLQKRAEVLVEHIETLNNRIIGYQQAQSELQEQKCKELTELLEIKLHLTKMEEKPCDCGKE
jgi:hypothetical protein